jgi:hypothetical protein
MMSKAPVYDNQIDDSTRAVWVQNEYPHSAQNKLYIGIRLSGEPQADGKGRLSDV